MSGPTNGKRIEAVNTHNGTMTFTQEELEKLCDIAIEDMMSVFGSDEDTPSNEKNVLVGRSSDDVEKNVSRRH